MIAILDYDAGNIKSVEKAFKILGEETVLTRDFSAIEKADRVVLPGVGSFADAMDHLKNMSLIRPLRIMSRVAGHLLVFALAFSFCLNPVRNLLA